LPPQPAPTTRSHSISFEFFELVTELETPIDPFERSCVMN